MFLLRGSQLSIHRLSPRPTPLGSSRSLATLRGMTSAMTVKYMTPEELAAIIKSDKVPMKDYFVVDVRDDDWQGGNIKGSHNEPSSGFFSKVQSLVNSTKNVPIVVFHCALSQVRGPKAARVYAEIRGMHDIPQSRNATLQQQIYILRGGFSDFQAKYRDDPHLVENWDAEVWASEWS